MASTVAAVRVIIILLFSIWMEPPLPSKTNILKALSPGFVNGSSIEVPFSSLIFPEVHPVSLSI